MCFRCSSPNLRSISFSAHISTHRWEDKHFCIGSFFLICHQPLVLSCVTVAHQLNTSLLSPVQWNVAVTPLMWLKRWVGLRECCYCSSQILGYLAWVWLPSCCGVVACWSQQNPPVAAPLALLWLSAARVVGLVYPFMAFFWHKETFKHNKVCLFNKLKPSVCLLLSIILWICDVFLLSTDFSSLKHQFKGPGWWICCICCKELIYLLKYLGYTWSSFVPRSVGGGCSRLADVSSSRLPANGSSCYSLCAAGVQPKPRGQRSHTNQATSASHERNIINRLCLRRASRLNASSSCSVRIIRVATREGWNPPRILSVAMWLHVFSGVYGDVQRVKILFNKKENALVQMSDATQAQLGQTFAHKLFKTPYLSLSWGFN